MEENPAEDRDVATQLFLRLGGQLTGPRRIILQAIPDDRPFRPDRLWQGIRAAHPALGRATVFRTLRRLREMGLLERTQDTEGASAFRLCAACAAGHHHHLHCIACGRDTLVEGDRLQAIEQALAQLQTAYGHTPVGHELQLHGVCARCTPRPSTASDHRW